MMKEVLLSMVSGVLVGGVFSLIKLPVPAPPTLAGVMGVIGIFLGYMIVKYFIGA